MGKLFVPSKVRTPADEIRRELDRAEHIVSNLRGAGSDALELLHLLDEVAGGLIELEEGGVDVRAERTRLEMVQSQLRRRKGQFLSEVDGALREEREEVQPNRARWWWFLDEIAARQRRRRLRRAVLAVVGAVVLLAAGWLAYDRFIAPPRSVRQAFRHKETGKSLLDQGELSAALDEFDAATALTPDDPEAWVWKGVLKTQLNEPDEARTAFDRARPLYEAEASFLLDRGSAYLRAGDLGAAQADADQVIAEDPESGWGYYLRAGVKTARGEFSAAVDDLRRAAELARAAGDAKLEAYARTKLAPLLESVQSQTPTPP